MKRFTTILIVILLLGVSGYYTYNHFISWHEEKIESARQQTREEIKLRESPPVPKEKLIEAFGEAPADIPHKESFDNIDDKVTAFFYYLDLQDYIKAYKLEKGTRHEFQQSVRELSSNLPLVSGETESLYTLFKNISHLYRALGKKRINLIKDIFRNESEIIESVTNTFFLWFTLNSSIDEKKKGRPSLEVLYRYSGFFLNTLAGRNYLLRRVPKVRVLTAYYCVLILDKANDSGLNSNGIDIRPHIKMLLTDIGNQTGFINKEQYMSELEKLEEKYKL